MDRGRRAPKGCQGKARSAVNIDVSRKSLKRGSKRPRRRSKTNEKQAPGEPQRRPKSTTRSPKDALMLSTSHTLILSYPHTLILSCSHTLIPSYSLTLFLSRSKPPTSARNARVRPPHTSMRSRFRALVLSCCRTRMLS